jgi:pyruvate kinase
MEGVEMASTETSQPSAAYFASLIEEIERLRGDVKRHAASRESQVATLPEERRESARNLLRYIAMRRHDLRPLQERLARVALSSIGRSESNVLATLDSVLHNLRVLAGENPGEADVYREFNELAPRLEQNTARLLGSPPANRRARIMVTMPESAADDYLYLHHLVEGGMDCVRINCAHGGPDNWSKIIHLKGHAERIMKRSCRVLMDLRGPKLRTGPMEPAPSVLKIRPVRDDYGRVERPARIWLTASPGAGNECESADACVTVSPEWLAHCRENDKVRFRDARGSKRRWRIIEVGRHGCWAEAMKTVYLGEKTRLSLKGKQEETPVGALPARASEIRLRKGDRLLLVNSDEPGAPALIDEDGTQLRPGRVSLPIPEVYRDAEPGHRVALDDGRVTGLVEKCLEDRLQVRITHTRKPEEKLGADKGINLPDTTLKLPALSDEDIADLPFIAAHADMVALSFTNTPEDVAELRRRLLDIGADTLGLVVKIETRRGFENLPEILLEVLKFPACGVMIARGDLAAECGFERMAELQEEILWICESAHVPVIWATQVLEGLTKRGHATRAEITDAAMGQSAECVMLNKGPYILDAVRTLNDILQRMQDHQTKKRSMMRKLRLAGTEA